VGLLGLGIQIMNAPRPELVNRIAIRGMWSKFDNTDWN